MLDQDEGISKSNTRLIYSIRDVNLSTKRTDFVYQDTYLAPDYAALGYVNRDHMHDTYYRSGVGKQMDEITRIRESLNAAFDTSRNYFKLV